VRTLSLFISLTLLSPLAHASAVIELSTFPKSSDEVVQRCYDEATAATKKGKALCDEKGFGPYWVCPPSREIRLKPLERCRSEAKNAKDQAAMLYLLGLLHQDFRSQDLDRGRGCPEFYRYQEGSALCVYTNDHFDQLIQRFPESRYAEMGAFKRAEEMYRYYECEGQKLCVIENQIVGWIYFLETRPKSTLADQATNKIVAALGSLSPTTKLDLRWETPEGLLEDVETLNAMAAKLSPTNREKLRKSLERIKPILVKIQEAQAAMEHKGS
jgi:hypothetical protein